MSPTCITGRFEPHGDLRDASDRMDVLIMNAAPQDLKNSLAIPASKSGIKNFLKSLHLPKRESTPLVDEPAWDPRFVAPAVEDVPRLTLSELGYSEEEIRAHTGVDNDLALHGPLRLFTKEGVRCLADVGRKLRAFAADNNHVISSSTRGAQRHSRFLYNMLRDPAFLIACSRIVGVPLIPHPLTDAAIQVNYYSPSADKLGSKEVSKWHYDGMDYVFTLLLTDRSEYRGGKYCYYEGRRDSFVGDPDKLARLRTVAFQRPGDTLYTLGSLLYHCVTPVIEGHRSTLVISLFCPYRAAYDSNRFWHLAPDDGLLRTARDWLRFRVPTRAPDYYFKQVKAPLVTWDML